MNTKFYEFSQNNTGGSFVTNDTLCHRLMIEADSVESANKKAESLGCYWDGCSFGQDCSCCGDRWYQASEYDKLDFPKEYTKDLTFLDIESYAQHLADKYGWTTPDARIFYADGNIKEIFTKKKA